MRGSLWGSRVGEDEKKGDRRVRMKRGIRGDMVLVIEVLAREHSHVLMREPQIEVELGRQPRDGSAAQPSGNIVLPVSRPQPSMIVIDRRSTGNELHSSGDRNRRKGGQPQS